MESAKEAPTKRGEKREERVVDPRRPRNTRASAYLFE